MVSPSLPASTSWADVADAAALAAPCDLASPHARSGLLVRNQAPVGEIEAAMRVETQERRIMGRDDDRSQRGPQ